MNMPIYKLFLLLAVLLSAIAFLTISVNEAYGMQRNELTVILVASLLLGMITICITLAFFAE